VLLLSVARRIRAWTGDYPGPVKPGRFGRIGSRRTTALRRARFGARRAIREEDDSKYNPCTSVVSSHRVEVSSDRAFALTTVSFCLRLAPR